MRVGDEVLVERGNEVTLVVYNDETSNALHISYIMKIHVLAGLSTDVHP